MYSFQIGSEICSNIMFSKIDNTVNRVQGTPETIDMYYTSSRDGMRHIKAFPINQLPYKLRAVAESINNT